MCFSQPARIMSTRPPFLCLICNKSFQRRSNLKRHEKNVHKSRKFGCLVVHIKSVHLKERFPCKICAYQATFRNNLSHHVKNVHQKIENINCSECNKSIQKGSLKRHMKKFHSGEQTLYNCKVCTFQTIHQQGLSRHVRNVHKKLF